MLRIVAVLGCAMLAGCAVQSPRRSIDRGDGFSGYAQPRPARAATFAYEDPDARYIAPAAGEWEEPLAALSPAEEADWSGGEASLARYAEDELDAALESDGGYGGWSDGYDPGGACDVIRPGRPGRPSRPVRPMPIASGRDDSAVGFGGGSGIPARAGARSGPANRGTAGSQRSAPVRSGPAPRGGDRR